MRALILSDIHGNLEALDAVLAAALGEYDEVWNLGDIVGYGAAPNQVIDRVRSLPGIVVRGNHDRVCCGLTSALNFNPVARAAALWTRDQLTEPNLVWLRDLPQGPVNPSQQGVTCSHGSPLDEDKYILNMRDAWVPLQQTATPFTFFGHTHIQGGFSQKGDRWHELRTGIARPAHAAPADSATLLLEPGTHYLINPGSVGQPRDFDWRAAFAIYSSGPNSGSNSGPDPVHSLAHITFHRIPYDLVSSQGRILMAGLPERLAARLREGR